MRSVETALAGGASPQSASIEGVDGHHLAAAGEQHGEHRALVGAADRAGVATLRRPAPRRRAPGRASARRYDRSSPLRSTRHPLRSACDRPAMSRCHGRRHARRATAHHRLGDATSPSATRCCAASCSTTPRSAPRSRSPAEGGRWTPMTSSMADLGRPCGYFNGAVLLRPPADWDAVLTRVERFLGGGRGQACLWSAWPTPDLHRRGWRLSGHPPLLIRPPLSTNPVTTAAQSSSTSAPVTGAVELADWERAAIDGYPLPELRDAPVGAFAPPALLDDDRLHFFLGRDASRPVAAARLVRLPRDRLARLRRDAPSGAPPRVLAPTRRRAPPGNTRRCGRPACSATSAGPAPSRSASCRSCA